MQVNNADVPTDAAGPQWQWEYRRAAAAGSGWHPRASSRILSDPTPESASRRSWTSGAYEYNPGLVGDISGDGHVDILDLLYLSGAWGSTTGGANYSAACDLNQDGSVDIIDLLFLADNWGK